MRKITLTTLLLALALMCAGVRADILTAAADTYVHNYAPDATHGSDTTLQADNDGGGYPKDKDRIAVIRFNLSSVTGPFGGATITLTGTRDAGFAYSIYGINDGGTDENFDESTLTFNDFAYTAEGADGGGDGSLITTGLTLLATGVTDDADGITDEVFHINTPDLLSFINADTNNTVTFVVFATTQSGNFEAFNSKEAASGGPTLTLVPEPATLSLLAFGGVALLAGRKRNV